MSVTLMLILIGAGIGIAAYRKWNQNRKKPVA
jgi:predicted transporter